MLKKIISVLFVTALLTGFTNCTSGNQEQESKKTEEEVSEEPTVDMKAKLSKYITVTLKADISGLSDNQKKMLDHLFSAAQIMDDIYWKQSFGDKAALLSSIDDTETTEFVKINYGPWDRLDGNNPFISSYGEKPKGANFYPKDMTVEEFEQFDDPDKTNLYTLIRRNEDGSLKLSGIMKHMLRKQNMLLNI